MAQGAQLGALWWPKWMGRVKGWEVQQGRGRDICMQIADSLCYTVEANTTL